MVGRKITYNGREVGHVVRVEKNSVVCAIDDDALARDITGGKTTFSMEVVSR